MFQQKWSTVFRNELVFLCSKRSFKKTMAAFCRICNSIPHICGLFCIILIISYKWQPLRILWNVHAQCTCSYITQHICTQQSVIFTDKSEKCVCHRRHWFRSLVCIPVSNQYEFVLCSFQSWVSNCDDIAMM